MAVQAQGGSTNGSTMVDFVWIFLPPLNDCQVAATSRNLRDVDGFNIPVSVQGMVKLDKTMKFNFGEPGKHNAHDVLFQVYEALDEKGYNPINQIVGYLLSGDPAYIPRHKDARKLILRIERDELIEELVTFYLKQGPK